MIAVRCNGTFPETEVKSAVREVYNMKGLEDKLPELGFRYSNSFIILINN